MVGDCRGEAAWVATLALACASGPEDAIRAAFADQGLTPLFIGKESGDLPARAACSRNSGAAALVVAGGDGTVACAARVLAGGAMPLGILPSGTMNLLARDLAIPIGDLAAAVVCLAEGRRVRSTWARSEIGTASRSAMSSASSRPGSISANDRGAPRNYLQGRTVSNWRSQQSIPQ